MLRENKLLFNLYQIYKYILYFPLLGLGTAFFFLITIPIMFFGTERMLQIGGIWWARFNSYVTPMFISVSGTENIDKEQSYVIVANHQSQYDIFAVYGWLPVDFRWVMKQELRKVPILGYYCYKAGHVYIDRSNHEKALASIEAAKARIRNGTSILFFPEGTRSTTGQLLPFKKGAFKFALDMGLPLLPITIIGTRNVLPNNSIALFPGSARMVVHKPIPIDGYTEENIEDLMDKARAAIQQGFDGNAN